MGPVSSRAWSRMYWRLLTPSSGWRVGRAGGVKGANEGGIEVTTPHTLKASTSGSFSNSSSSKLFLCLFIPDFPELSIPSLEGLSPLFLGEASILL